MSGIGRWLQCLVQKAHTNLNRAFHTKGFYLAEIVGAGSMSTAVGVTWGPWAGFFAFILSALALMGFVALVPILTKGGDHDDPTRVSILALVFILMTSIAFVAGHQTSSKQERLTSDLCKAIIRVIHGGNIILESYDDSAKKGPREDFPLWWQATLHRWAEWSNDSYVDLSIHNKEWAEEFNSQSPDSADSVSRADIVKQIDLATSLLDRAKCH